jgi:hypothetical protein
MVSLPVARSESMRTRAATVTPPEVKAGSANNTISYNLHAVAVLLVAVLVMVTHGLVPPVVLTVGKGLTFV